MEYFHELPKDTISKLIEDKKNWEYVMENYKQPDWCNYPDALAGQAGCWSLVDIGPAGLREKISESFCKTCSENKNYEHKNILEPKEV